MLPFVLPLIVFAAPTPAPPASAEDSAPFLVAQALVDADQLVAVHQAPGIVVFDLDRADERFQMTVRIDDDGVVVASTIDWVGASDDRFGLASVAFGDLPVVERIDWEPTRNAIVLRGGGHAVRLPLGGQA